MASKRRKEPPRTFDVEGVINELYMNSDSEGENDFIVEESDDGWLPSDEDDTVSMRLLTLLLLACILLPTLLSLSQAVPYNYGGYYGGTLPYYSKNFAVAGHGLYGGGAYGRYSGLYGQSSYGHYGGAGLPYYGGGHYGGYHHNSYGAYPTLGNGYGNYAAAGYALNSYGKYGLQSGAVQQPYGYGYAGYPGAGAILSPYAGGYAGSGVGYAGAQLGGVGYGVPYGSFGMLGKTALKSYGKRG